MFLDTMTRTHSKLAATLLTLCAIATTALALPAFASARVDVGVANVGTASTNPAQAKVTECTSAPYAADRRIVLTSKMQALPAQLTAPRMQVRFDVYRKLLERKTPFRKLRATGLGKWFSNSDPNATAYQREVTLTGIETYAKYRAVISFRWLDADGKVLAKKVRTTSTCKQRYSLPRLTITGVKSVPIAGSNNRHYTVSILNSGGAAAESLPVSIWIDQSSPSSSTIVDSVGPGSSYDAQLDAPSCTTNGWAALDGRFTLRLAGKSHDTQPAVCK
jgi:hypothetical protein